jgi:hypothetical protein
MLCDETAESAGKNARELGAALVGAHAFRVTPGVRFDVFVVGHGHYGDPAKRGPSEMTYAVCSRVLRKVITRGSTGAGRVASRWRTYRTHHTPPRERRQRGCAHGRKGWTDESDPITRVGLRDEVRGVVEGVGDLNDRAGVEVVRIGMDSSLSLRGTRRLLAG